MPTPLIFHIDVNSAFLSWESAHRLEQNPDALDLRLVNAVIGGDEEQRHGIVLAKSPSAKKYGIQTGEPLAHVRRKCPDLVIAPPNHALYAEYSKRFIAILEEVAPVIEQCSIDEAFCDMTGTTSLYGNPVIFANNLKDRIYNDLLTLPSTTNVTEKIYSCAKQLFAEGWNHTPIRLLGVSTGKASTESYEQYNLFDQDKYERLSKLNSAIDKIRSKYGDDSIKRACFIENETPS